MAELLVPLAFWNHVPTHNWFSYTCVLISPDKKKIVTGTASGRICIWEINNNVDSNKNESAEKNGKEDSSGIRIGEDETDKLVLRTVLLGHKSPIVALTSAACDEPCIVSVSQDGTICTWSYIDGHCIGASERLLKCLPTSVVAMPKGNHIACAGHSTFVEIVNLRKLKVTLTLSAHQHWITSLFATNLGSTYNPLLISAGSEGVIQFWSVKKGESDVPLQTLVLEIEEPLAVQLSPNSKTILIVTSEEWLLCTAKAGQEVCHVKCPEVGGWKGGVFLSNHICIVWSKAGNAYLYSLPRVQAQALHFATGAQSNSDPNSPVGSPGSFGKQSFLNNFQSSIIEDEDETIEAPKHVPANNFRASFLGKLNIKGPHGETPPICVYCSSSTPESYQVLNDHSGAAVPGLVVTANQQGKFNVWITPSRFPEKVNTTERVLPWATSHPEIPKEVPQPAPVAPAKDHHHLSGGFNLRSSYGSLVANMAAPQSNTPPVVTSSIVVEQLLLLVQGYNNGCISISTLPTSESAKPKYHQAHAVGTAVTALLSHIDGQLCRIVSGGEDFAVIIWNLKDNSYLQPLVRFSVHSGPVVKLFSPPSYSLPSDDNNVLQSKWKNRFFSISKDKTIALFSFSNVAWEHTYGVHPAPISDIKWQLDQDLLMVESEDGSVSLWEMSNAQLEGVYTGEMARDLMKFSSTLLPHYDSDFTLHQKAVSGFTVSSFHDPFPIQLLFINVKKLLSDLDKALRPSGIKAKGKKGRHQRSKSVSEAPPAPSSPTLSNNNNSTNAPPSPNPGTPSILLNATANLRNLTKGASFAMSPGNRESLSVSSGSIPKSISHEHIVDPVITAPPTHLHAYLMLTYFLPWGLDSEMDKLFKEKLGLSPPNPQHCFAIRGYGGKMTVLVPSGASKAYTTTTSAAHSSLVPTASTSTPNFLSNTFDRWKRSPFLSALHTLAAASFAHNLLGIDYFEDICNTLCTHYFSTIPDRVTNYVHPSLSFFAGFWQDPSEDVMQSARAALAATADRLPEDERKQFAKTWFVKFKDSHESKSLSLLVLGIFGSKYPGAMDTEIAVQVTDELLKLLQAEREASSLRVAAAELLGKGFKTWRPYIKDIDGLIQQLFSISLLQEPHNISATAHHALMMIGSSEPKQFVLSLGKYILEVHHNDMSGKSPNVSQHSAAMMTLGSLIKQDPASLLDLLPRVVETVVRSLDPHIPFLRDSCLVATTKVIHVLVEKYPMIGFHQETQRLAVGTKEALIVIYDLKTATRWHVLEGHAGPISAVSFSENGKMFASYSLIDAEVRLWQTTTAFLGLLGSNPHCVRTFKVNKVDKQLTPISILECIRLKWSNEKSVVLQRTWEGSITLKL